MYQPSERRYEGVEYKRCGRSGLKLPAMSLGLWQNFGTEKTLKEQEEILCHAFDRGITHFDLANNYGHPARGLAEENFGRALKDCLGPYRDELAVSTKAGYDMWQGPYGNWGSRKYLMASLDQSLRRMGLDYVDIFYHHRPDPETPLEETMEALSDMVRQGKALYVGISNYNAEQTAAAVKLLRENHTPCLIHQVRYNLLERQAEDGLFPVLSENGVGCICFSPLAQGALTDKYLRGIPAGSRAAREGSTVAARYLDAETLGKIKKLNDIARAGGMTLAQMALAWILRRPEVTSVLVGVSSTAQLDSSLAALKLPPLGEDVRKEIRAALGQ